MCQGLAQNNERSQVGRASKTTRVNESHGDQEGQHYENEVPNEIQRDQLQEVTTSTTECNDARA